MRVAITLPSIDPKAVVARQIDAVVRVLAGRVDTEVFVESTRLWRGDLPAPAFHYLRFDERHKYREFDTALYPMARDFLPYEPSYLLASRFTGVVWVLDPAMHHFLVGALGLLGRWDAYIKVLDNTFPARGARVGASVAGGWGTRALYDNYDPLVRTLSQRHRMLAATAPIADRMQRQGVAVEHVELPISGGVLGLPPEHSRTKGVVTVLSASPRWPQPLMWGLARLLEKRPELRIRYVTSENIHPAVAGPAALRAGLDGCIEWYLSPSPSRLLQVTDGAEIVVAVAPEPVAYERALLYRALAGGALTLVGDAPHYDFVPRHIAPRLTSGRGLGQALFVTIDTLLDDASLVAEMREEARRFVAAGADADSIAASVQAELERAQERSATPIRRSEATWEFLRGRLHRRCTPLNATEATRHMINGCLATVAPRVAGMTADS